MATSLTIVGLGGSLASSSKRRAALQTALGGAEAAGAETQRLDIRRLDLPMYSPDEDEPSPSGSRRTRRFTARPNARTRPNALRQWRRPLVRLLRILVESYEH